MRIVNDRGFTLVELLVMLAVLAVILAAVLALQQQGQATLMIQAAKIEAQQNSRVALDLMTRELRSATAVTAIAASDLTFVDQNTITIRYQLNSTNLDRTENGVTTTLIAGVQALAFTYRDANDAATTNPALVASVIVSMTTKPEHATSSSVPELQQPTSIEDRIRMRNML